MVACGLPSQVRGDSTELQNLLLLDVEVTSNADSPEPYLARARVLRRVGALDRARADLARAEELAHDRETSLDIELEWAAFHIVEGSATKARTRLESFLEGAPRHLPARRLLADVLSDVSDHHGAAAQWATVIELASVPTAEFYLARAASLELAGEGAAVRLALVEGVDRMGSVTVLLQRLYRLEREAGNTSQALHWLGRLQRETARSLEWKAEEGRYLASLGRDQEARRAWAEARRDLVRKMTASAGDSAVRRTPRGRRLLRELDAALATGQPSGR